MDLVVGLSPSEHATRGGGPLLDAVLPVLDTHLAPAHGMKVIGDVTRGEDAGHVGSALIVDDDPVVDPHGGARDELGDGLDTEPEDGQAALDAPPLAGHDALDPAGPLERRHGIVQDHLDAVVAMETLDHPADVFAERPIERRLERLDGDDLEPRLAHRRRDLCADEAESDDDRAAPARHRVADAVGVGHRAQVVDAGQIEAGNRDPAISAAGRDEQLIELEPVAVLQRERPLLRVDPHDRGPQAHLDVALSIEVRRPKQGCLERCHAAQVVLGEGRTIVRGLRLGADQEHAAVEAFLAQGRGGRRPGEAGADDRDRRHQNSTCTSLP